MRLGAQDTPAFEPDHVNANVGDQVTFHFHNFNHSLTQSSLENPCVPAGQLDSGFNQFNPTDHAGLTLTITVNSFEPQWFFCQQVDPTSHCHAGMVFALNPGNHMDEFLANARKQTIQTSSTALEGTTASGSPQATATPFAPNTSLFFPKTAASNLNASLSYSGSAFGTGGTGTATIRPTGSMASFPRSVPMAPFTGDARSTEPTNLLLVLLLISFLL